jgi:hypothetical protein
MGKCVLHFDQMEIIYKKSDLAHSDNDWLIVHWFVGPKLAQSHTVPLTNSAGQPFWTRETHCNHFHSR